MLKPIRNNKDYEKALERVYFLMQKELKKNSTEYAELEILSMLIEKYEDEKYPIDAPDPIEAILFRMEQLNLNKTDLAKIIGYKSRVSEILNRKRKLNLDMIRKLNTDLKIPLETLVRRYLLSIFPNCVSVLLNFVKIISAVADVSALAGAPSLFMFARRGVCLITQNSL